MWGNSLRSLGFQVHTQNNLDSASMESITNRLVRSIHPGAIVFFFFSGYGNQHDGYNFLILINNTLSQGDLKDRVISAERLIYDMHTRRPKIVIVILDSCRSNDSCLCLCSRTHSNYSVIRWKAQFVYLSFTSLSRKTKC